MKLLKNSVELFQFEAYGYSLVVFAHKTLSNVQLGVVYLEGDDDVVGFEARASNIMWRVKER